MNLTSLSLRCSIALLPALVACGKSDPAPEVSRSIPGVLLFSDAEGASASGFLPDNELSQKGIALNGGWYTYDDVGDCPMLPEPRAGVVNPAMGQKFVVSAYGGGITPPPGEEEDNTSALRFWGGGHELWGAGIGIGFKNPSGTPLKYDLTATGATGIRFWARTGAEPANVKIKIQDKWSEGEADPQECCFLDKNVCGANACGTGGDVQGCFDAPNIIKPLTTEWQLIQVSFAELVRGGWGQWVNMADHSMEPPALTEAYQLQLEVEKYAAFDIWVDNVGFIIPEAAAK